MAFPGCAGNATGLLKGVFMKYFEFFMTLLGYAAIFGLYFYLIFHIGRRKTIDDEGIVYTGHRPKKKKKHFLFDIFLKLPFQVGKDAARVMPDDFPYKGIVVFTGMQGSGKSIAMVQFARTMKEQYPDAMVLSNTALNFEDEAITDFQPIVDTKNGRKGVIIWMNYKTGLTRKVVQTVTEVKTFLRRCYPLLLRIVKTEGLYCQQHRIFICWRKISGVKLPAVRSDHVILYSVP